MILARPDILALVVIHPDERHRRARLAHEGLAPVGILDGPEPPVPDEARRGVEQQGSPGHFQARPYARQRSPSREVSTAQASGSPTTGAGHPGFPDLGTPEPNLSDPYALSPLSAAVAILVATSKTSVRSGRNPRTGAASMSTSSRASPSVGYAAMTRAARARFRTTR